MKNKIITKIFASVAAATLVLLTPVCAFSSERTYSYNYDYWGDVQDAPSSYNVCRVFTSSDLKLDVPLSSPQGVTVVNDKIYICDTGNNRIVKITDSTKKAATIAGSTKGTEGDNIGKPTKECRLYAPENVYYKSSTVVIADTGNSCVKVLKDGKVTRKIKESSMVNESAPVEPRGLLVVGKKLYVGDVFAKRLLSKTL